MGVLREIFTGIKNCIGSAAHVSNLMALFLVVALMGLVAYALYAKETYLAAIIGFSSAIIGTITVTISTKNILMRHKGGTRGGTSCRGLSSRLSGLGAGACHLDGKL